MRWRASLNLDRIQITPGYGLWTAGIGFQLGAERLGAMTVPMGPGNTDKQLRMMMDMKSTVLCATSSYALLLAEEIAKERHWRAHPSEKGCYWFRALGREDEEQDSG